MTLIYNQWALHAMSQRKNKQKQNVIGNVLNKDHTVFCRGLRGNAAELASAQHEVTETCRRDRQRFHLLLGWEAVWHTYTNFSEFLKCTWWGSSNALPSVRAVGPQKHLPAVLVHSEEREGVEIFIPFSADSRKLCLSPWYLVTYQNKEEELESFCPNGSHAPGPCLVLMLCGDSSSYTVAQWLLREATWLSSTPSTKVSFRMASKDSLGKGWKIEVTYLVRMYLLCPSLFFPCLFS